MGLAARRSEREKDACGTRQSQVEESERWEQLRLLRAASAAKVLSHFCLFDPKIESEFALF